MSVVDQGRGITGDNESGPGQRNDDGVTGGEGMRLEEVDGKRAEALVPRSSQCGLLVLVELTADFRRGGSFKAGRETPHQRNSDHAESESENHRVKRREAS